MLIGHLHIFFCEVSVQIFCPFKKSSCLETSLKSIAGSLGSIPGQGTKIRYAAQGGKKKVVLSYCVIRALYTLRLQIPFLI